MKSFIWIELKCYLTFQQHRQFAVMIHTGNSSGTESLATEGQEARDMLSSGIHTALSLSTENEF